MARSTGCRLYLAGSCLCCVDRWGLSAAVLCLLAMLGAAGERCGQPSAEVRRHHPPAKSSSTAAAGSIAGATPRLEPGGQLSWTRPAPPTPPRTSEWRPFTPRHSSRTWRSRLPVAAHALERAADQRYLFAPGAVSAGRRSADRGLSRWQIASISSAFSTEKARWCAFAGYRPHFIPLDAKYQGKTLTLRIYSDHVNIGVFGDPLLGSQLAPDRSHGASRGRASSSLARSSSSSGWLPGVRLAQRRVGTTLYYAGFTTSCGIWCLCQAQSRILFINAPPSSGCIWRCGRCTCSRPSRSAT